MMHINYCLKTENVKEIPGRRQLFSLSFDNLFPEECVVFYFQLTVALRWQLEKLTIAFHLYLYPFVVLSLKRLLLFTMSTI